MPCIRPTQPWESHAGEGHVVAEGAFVLKHPGPYYLTYTANHFLDPNYAIGYAVSEFPLGALGEIRGQSNFEQNRLYPQPRQRYVRPFT